MLVAAEPILGLHRLTWLSLAIQFVLVSFAAAAAPWFGLDPFSMFPLKTGPTEAAFTLGVTLAALGPPIAAFFWMQRSTSYPVARFRRDVRTRLAPLFGETRPVDWLAISASAGFAEEFVFRGVLLEALRESLPTPWGAAAAVAISSVIFGALHALNRTYFLAAMAAGVYFSLLVLFAGDLWAAALAHMLYDFVVFVRAAPQARRDLAKSRAREAASEGEFAAAESVAGIDEASRESSDVRVRD